MLLIYILLLIQTVLARDKFYYDIEKAEEYFQEFMTTHNKSYNDPSEWSSRYQVFKDNLLQINEMNRKDPHSTFGINQFCDLSSEEFISQYTGFRSDLVGDECRTEFVLNSGDAPQALDWRERISMQVKDQQSCGSCWAFAATGQIEALYAMHAIQYEKTLSLSEQQLVDCDFSSEGCSGGTASGAFQYLIKSGGQASEDAYPYVNRQEQCHFSPKQAVANLSDCVTFQPSTEDVIRELVYKYGPVTAAIDGFSLKHWNGGIISDCQNQNINHAVMIVGYGTDPVEVKDYWVIKNSWGTKWGEKGYVRIERGVNACGIVNPYIAAAVL